MSVERARAHLQKYGLEGRILEFGQSSATVEEAAQAVGCGPERIAKTLSFLAGEDALLIVTAGDARIDNAKYKGRFGAKARMIPGGEVEERIGHAVGGVCPFGVKNGVKVYLDVSLRRFQSVFPACGAANNAIELTIPELEKTSRYEAWVDVCKDWGPLADEN